MAPLKLIREAGRMLGQGQRLANRGQGEFVRAGEEMSRTPPSRLKHWFNQLDLGADFVEVNMLERLERYAWLSCRTGLALGALFGSAYGIKYTVEEVWVAPRPFEQYLFSSNNQSNSQIFDTPVLSYEQVKILATEMNEKLIKEYIAGMKQAANEGLLDTYSRDRVLKHKKRLESTHLTLDQRSEVHTMFLRSIVKELDSYHLRSISNVSGSDEDSTISKA